MNTEQISKNITLLAKAKGVKISDIESAAEVGKGYISRTRKDLKLAVIQVASTMLDTSITDLIGKDMSKTARIITLNNKLADNYKAMELLKATETAIVKELSELEGEEFIEDGIEEI